MGIQKDATTFDIQPILQSALKDISQRFPLRYLTSLAIKIRIRGII